MTYPLKQQMRICDCCLAENGAHVDQSMNFKNFGPDKAWPLTRINHRMYVAMPGELSPWRVVPGWSLESNTFDFMHNLYLGSGRDLLASTFKALIQRGVYSHLPETDMDSILAFLQEEMIRDCSMLGFLGVIGFAQMGPPNLKTFPKIIHGQVSSIVRLAFLGCTCPKSLPLQKRPWVTATMQSWARNSKLAMSNSWFTGLPEKHKKQQTQTHTKHGLDI